MYTRFLNHCLAIAALSMTLFAQQTGRITGSVSDSAGKPIQGATIVLKRLDVTFSKEIKTNRRGSFMQVGLDPKEYEMTVTAEGFVGHREVVKIPLNEFLEKNIVLRTPQEAVTSPSHAAPLASSADTGDIAYRGAVELYNDRNFAEAMPMFETAVENYRDSLSTENESPSADEIKRFLAIAVQSLAVCRYEVGKADEARRRELWESAEPVLLETLDAESDPKSNERARMASFLLEIAKFRGDAQAEKKYADILEEIEGPNARKIYNEAVRLYNEGRMAEAVPLIRRVIEIDPTFDESYYLLAYCLLGDDLDAGKANFRKYLEIAPDGKYAEEVREVLGAL